MSVHKPKICLACSAGGHLRELQLAIGDIPNNWNCYWLTLKTTSTKAFMKDKEHVFLVNFQPAKKWSLIINCISGHILGINKTPKCNHNNGSRSSCTYCFLCKKATKIQSDLYQLSCRCNARIQNPYMDRKIYRSISRSMGRNENYIS